MTAPTFPVPTSRPLVYTVHDFLPLTHPHWFGRVHRWGFRGAIADARDRASAVIADSAAWATQMRLLTSAVLRRLNTELGHGTVTRVVVRGPAPPRRMGPLRVRGTREHNDDYG